jgi:hypothetical protein
VAPRVAARDPVEHLALKLVLTPALIAAASLAGRRWGPGVSGWLVGLPLTSGPVAFFLALDHGAAFAAAAAVGSLAGTAAQTAFCLAYGWLARRSPWPLALLAGAVAFGAVSAALERRALVLTPLFVGAVVVLAAGIRLMPETVTAAPAGSLPRWDLPARMVVATALVLLLTGLAPILGPRLAGILATFPVFAGILAAFAHRLQGPGSAAGVLRGLLLGLFSFAGFFFVLGALLERAGIAPAFSAALLVALGLQAGSLRAARR